MKQRASFAVGLRIALLFISGFVSDAAFACGAQSDCLIGERYYRIRLPDMADEGKPAGAIIFAHGYKGNAVDVMANLELAAIAQRLHVALVAVKSAGDGWAIPGTPSDPAASGIDELTYFDQVLEDIRKKFGIDGKRVMVTGFSAGGMMVWNLACHRSGSFGAFVPMAGTFWRPIPATCSEPVATIVHIHGDSDHTVPLEGRRIARAQQGAVADALDMYGRFGAFSAPVTRQYDDLACQDRANAGDKHLHFCLYSGGHDFHESHVEMAWKMAMPSQAP